MVFLLSVYLMGLNFIPCDDLAPTAQHQEISIAEHTDSHQHSQNHEQQDLCSPFCQCHCCHIHILDFNFSEVVIFHPNIPILDIGYANRYGLDIQHSLLQPPQV